MPSLPLGPLEDSRPLRWASTLALLAATTFLDWLTGDEISFSLFYLIPIALVTWTGARGEGRACALLSAAAWHLIDAWVGNFHYSNPLIPYWNAAIRLAYFLLTVEAIGLARESIETARRASKLKSDMLAFTSHELNNSIAAVSMAVFLLRENSADAGMRGAVLSSVERAISQMRISVGNFLDGARLDSGRFSVVRRSCHLRTVVAECLDAIRPVAEHKGVTLLSDFPTELVPLNADPDVLSVVVANLVSNAVKYTPAGGRAVISLEPGRPAADLVTVSVRDSGIGMSEADLAKVLAGNYRTEAGMAAAKGHGIGLSIVRRLLEAHGTRLEVRSAPGEGTTVSFTLPRAAS